MLLAVVDACEDEAPAWKELAPPITRRAQRYAAILERFIAPDGSFPAIGRSLAYRCGAFHLLADVALRRLLPGGVSPAQVRGATAVVTRTIDAPGTFDRDGWLQIGFCGHQPGIGETYISTGSLYLCSVAFLPLGLAAKLTHKGQIQYFVGPGGPVPLTPGYVPYVVTTRSPRDYFAFPPFSDQTP